MKKKLLSALLCVAMVASLVVGCGGTTDAPAEDAATEDVATDDTAEPTKIQVAAIETAYGADMWKEVTAAFTAETGIEVELITNQQLEAVISPNMQAGNFPDVIHLATGRADALTEQFIKENLITDITDVLSMTVPGEDKLVSEKIAGGFTETSLTNPYGDGKTYLAPMFYSPCGLF